MSDTWCQQDYDCGEGYFILIIPLALLSSSYFPDTRVTMHNAAVNSESLLAAQLLFNTGSK